MLSIIYPALINLLTICKFSIKIENQHLSKYYGKEIMSKHKLKSCFGMNEIIIYLIFHYREHHILHHI
jgi:hypothetical protein